MEVSASGGKGPETGMSSGRAREFGYLIEAIVRKSTITFSIDKNELPLYLKTAKKTGWTVSVIAKEGEEYPAKDIIGGVTNRESVQINGEEVKYSWEKPAISKKIVGKNCLAVSLFNSKKAAVDSEKFLNDENDFTPFWKKFESLKPKKAKLSSESTVKL